MGETYSVISKCKGLNTKDHPSQLASKTGSYLSLAVNVNITDTGGIERRSGYSVLQTGYSNAHSLTGYLNRYAVYANEDALYCYNVVDGGLSTIFTGLTPDKPICYTEVGDMLVFSNGVERGMIELTGGEVICSDYFAFLADPSQSEREIVEMPTTDIVHYFSGSMYGAISGENFLYCSEPYKINHYDQIAGYIPFTAAINWIKSTEGGLLVGTDDSVYALEGNGLADFKQVRIRTTRSQLCSEYHSFSITDSYYGKPEERQGVLALCADGIFFIDDKLEAEDLSDKLAFDWQGITAGTFGKINNNYIFSGVTT